MRYSTLTSLTTGLLLVVLSLVGLGIGLPPKVLPAFPIRDSVDQYIFNGRELAYLEDSLNQLTIQEVTKGKAALHFITNTLYVPHNVHISSYYWIKVRIQGNPASSKKWLLELFDQSIDYVEAYIPQGDGSYKQYLAGDQLPFQQRMFQHKNFEFEIPNNIAASQEYYFKLKSANRANIIIVVRSVDRLIYYALNEYFVYGIFYGMILLVAIYNLLMFFAIKETQFIIYVIYVLSVGIYSMCADGIAFQYLWPSHPTWNQVSYAVALFFVILAALVFTKMFLHTSARHPKLNQLINATIGLRVLVFLCGLLFYPKLFEYRWIEFLPLSVAFYTGIYSYLHGYKPARFFALAYGLLFISFWVKILINLDVPLISGSIFTHYSISIGFWFEMWLLSFALGDKVRIIKESKDRALRRIIQQHEVNQQLKEKVNRELEVEVQNRTREIQEQKKIIESQNQDLQEVNEKIKAQAEKINKMNALLDFDNYKLKRSIQEEMLARVGSRNMDYVEFKKIFPDELTCFRYLEQEKWKHGFVCKKCKNDKHLAGKGKFDRRCTRCGYIESPTAYTIFHGIKFPIEKAFYLVHLLISGRHDLSIDQLSQILDLRRNTCWNFKDKVKTAMQRINLDKGKTVQWEHVLFDHES